MRIGARWVRATVLCGLAWLCGCAGSGVDTKSPETTSGAYDGRPDLGGVDSTPVRGRRILIDPGHGGRFAGAEGLAKTREADVNLGVGLYLWGLLHDAGADVHLTRASDRDLLAPNGGTVRDDLAARVHAIDSLAPDVFLSLHHNSNAALDRERNAIETYYKLDDEGPSYDLGRAIHAQLSRHLGIEAASLLPGNYFVLRGADTAAVLGEASYLSNPGVESKLQLAEKQRLEATAYFLGLVNYFARGAAAIVKVAPAGDTLRAGDNARFAVSEPVDPLTLEALVDGVPRLAWLDHRGEIVVDRDLPAGAHEWLVRARLARGNAARPWTGSLVVHTRPAHAVWVQEPARVGADSRLRIQVHLQDAAGRPVGDGIPVRWTGTHLALVAREDSTRGGSVVAHVRVRSGARLRLRAESLDEEFALRVEADAARVRFVQCIDARSQRPVAGAHLDSGAASDRLGMLQTGAEDAVLRVESRGHVPWSGAAGADSVLRLGPVHDGLLHGVRFALDAGGAGGESSLPGGVSAGDLAYDICRLIDEQLVAGGAVSRQVRDFAAPTSDLERIRRAVVLRAEWYVRVELVPQETAQVLHYPGSAGGEQLANGLATMLRRRLEIAAPVRTDTRFVLQQTPCPAVLVLLPVSAASGANGARRCTAALSAGLRAGLDPQAARWAPLVGSVVGGANAAALVTLDAAEVTPVDVQGGFRFDAVVPGRHVLRSIGATPFEIEVRTSGNDTTRVRLGAPVP